jgi:pyruvate/2-oxoglutarate/acetoin dehydrogenase E1 component
VPLVIRMANGAGRQLAAQHSHSLEGWYAHIPGIKVLAPATVEDARYMLQAALADPNPVLIFEHIMLYNMEGELDPAIDAVDISSAKVRRPGEDVTVVTYGGSLFKSLEAAAALAQDGIEAEVIDLRTLRPLDLETVLASVRKTNRIVTVEEAWPVCSVGSEICAQVAMQAFDDLDAPPVKISGADVPMPYAANLEKLAHPSAERVVAAAKSILYV